MDGVDPAVVGTVERRLLGTPGVRGVRHLRVRWLGHTLHAAADLDVDPALTFAQSPEIPHEAEQRLLADVRRLTGATLHTSPARAHPERA